MGCGLWGINGGVETVGMAGRGYFGWAGFGFVGTGLKSFLMLAVLQECIDGVECSGVNVTKISFEQRYSYGSSG